MAADRVATKGDVRLLARATTTPGVDITISARGIKNEMARRLSVLNTKFIPFDTVTFTGNTTSASTSLTSVVLSTGTPVVGMIISGTGIPSGTTITAISGTTYTLSLSATVTAATLTIYQPQTDFPLPMGYTAYMVELSGVRAHEGATKIWTRIFDGFIETVRFNVAQGANTWVQIFATKENLSVC